jgi:hypothetical protein
MFLPQQTQSIVHFHVEIMLQLNLNSPLNNPFWYIQNNDVIANLKIIFL